MYGKSDVGSITFNDQNNWKFQVTDSNIVAAAVVLTFTAFLFAVMQADYLDIGDIKGPIAMFLLSVYGVAKTLVSQYVVLPLKSWTGVVGASEQSVTLFTGAGKNLIGSSLKNFAVAIHIKKLNFGLYVEQVYRLAHYLNLNK